MISDATPLEPLESGQEEKDSGHPLLVRRVRAALLLILGSCIFLPLLEYLFRGVVSPPVEMLLLQLIIVVIVFLRLARRVGDNLGETLATLIAICIASSAFGIMSQNATTTLLLLMITAMTSATLIPWGAVRQSITVGVAAVAFSFTVLVVHGNLQAFGYATSSAIAFAFAISVYVAYELERDAQQRVRRATRSCAHRRSLATGRIGG